MTIIEKKCLLHIGAPKTGSTSLGKFLAHNRNVLKQHDWKYPDVSLRGYGHHDLAFLINGAYPEWATPQDRPLDDLLKEFLDETEDCSRIILSSENFYLYSQPEKTANILAQAGFSAGTVKVIVYIRRQDEVHMSWYNQAVKAQGYSGSINDCIAETMDLWNYEARLKPWAATFGRGNVLVRPYESTTLVQGDICADFLNLADLSTEDFDWPEDVTNTRINRDILEFQRLINRLPLSVQEKRRFHKELIELTAATASTDLFDDSSLLTADQRRKILSSYAASNANVARAYLGRERLFNETISADPPGKNTLQGLTLEKLVYIMGWVLARKQE